MQPAKSPTDDDATTAKTDNIDTTGESDTLIEAELLVEDVSIDGMCGVY